MGMRERVEHLADEAELLAEDVRRLLPLRLVGGHLLVAEGGLRAVPGATDDVGRAGGPAGG